MNPPLNGSSAVWLVLICCNLLSLGFQLSTFHAGWCSSAVIFFLSPQGFQLPTFCAGWCSSAISSFSFLGVQLLTFHAGLFSSAVIFFLFPRGFQLPSFRAGWCSSAVIFFLSPRGFSCHSFAFTGTSLLWGNLSFTSSLSSAPGTLPLPPLSQHFTPLFHCLCSTSSSVSFVSVTTPIFLLLHWFESSSGVAVGIHVYTQISMCMFRVKRVTVTCIYGTTYIHTYIYMKNPPFNSLVWGLLRHAPTIFALSTALYLLYFVLHLQQYYT